MNCSRCGKPVAAGAAFCMHCGAPVAPARPGTPVSTIPPASGGALQTAYADQAKRNRTILAVITGVGLVLALFVGLFASGTLKLGASRPDSKTLQARGNRPDLGTLQVQASTAPPVTQKTAERVVMPADVRAWLEHLEKIEARKIELSLQQTAEMTKYMQMASVLGAGIGSMNPYDQTEGEDTPPDRVTQGKFLDLKPEWERLISDFQSFAPPAVCKPLADDYGRALGEIPGSVADLEAVLNAVSTDPTSALAKASALKGKSFNQIDRYFVRSDERLTEICDKFNERKWFNIKADVMAGGLMGKLGSGAAGAP